VIADPDVQRTRKRIVLEGDIPSPLAPPSGCAFRTRCPLEPESAPRSHEEFPPLVDVGRGHLVACHLARRGHDVPQLIDAPTELVSGVGSTEPHPRAEAAALPPLERE